jgi:predicted dehydrogenase
VPSSAIRRRDLLGALAAPFVRGAVPPGDRIVMGHIGVGEMGTGHVGDAVEYPEVRVVAVCDVRRRHRERAKAIVDGKYGDTACAMYADFRELLARPDIDAVVIAVPDHWHALIGLEAARRGKHMYYEKPMGVSLAEAAAMRAAVNRYGVVFQFGTQQRSTADFRFACELARNGRIGQLRTIMIASATSQEIGNQPTQPVPEGFDYDFWLGPAPWAPYTYLRTTRNWTLIYDYSLGCISGAWGIHDVDIAQWANDADSTGPLEAEGRATFPREGLYDTPTAWEIEHKYANGVRLIHMDLRTARKRAEQFQQGGMASVFLGTEGWIYVSRNGMRTYPESLMRTAISPNEIRLPRSNDHKRNFFDAIRGRGRPVSPIEAAVRSETVCQQADIAIRLGRKLRWDPAKERFIDDDAANRMLARPMRSPWRL